GRFPRPYACARDGAPGLGTVGSRRISADALSQLLRGRPRLGEGTVPRGGRHGEQARLQRALRSGRRCARSHRDHRGGGRWWRVGSVDLFRASHGRSEMEGISNGRPSYVTLAARAPSLVSFCFFLGACKPRQPERTDYRVVRAAGPAASLLAADEGAWRTSKRIEWGPDAYTTVFRGAWTSAGFFVRFDVTDPSQWHTLTHHDDKLWNEEVVEIFLQPAGSQGDYGEIEISPANVTCDVWVKSSPRQFDVTWNLEGL